MHITEYPPKLLPDEEVLVFKDGLEDIIPIKLEELMDRQDELVKIRQERLQVLTDSNPRVDEVSEYIWLLWTEIEFEEYYLIKRWLKYWLRLAEKASNNKEVLLPPQEGGVSEEQIEKAKEYLLEELYEGKLRNIGARLIGICPFHKEKTPSFNIFLESNRFYCFGCHVHGDAIDFYQRVHNCDLIPAVLALQ